MRLLPDSVAVLWSHEVPDDFHARYSALSRTYRYELAQPPGTRGAVPRITSAGSICHSTSRSMRAAAALFVGEHDFSAFRSSECQAKSPVRTIHQFEISKRGGNHRLRGPRQRFPAPHGAQPGRHAGVRRQGQAPAAVGSAASAVEGPRASPRPLSARKACTWRESNTSPNGSYCHNEAGLRTRVKICGITRPARRARSGASRRRRDRAGVLPAEPALICRSSARARSATRCRPSCRRVALFVNADARAGRRR